MSSPQDHLEQAEHNKTVADRVREDYPDWAVTIYFYAALHWVERYAKLNGCDIESEYPDGRSLHECRKMYLDDVAYKLRNKKLRQFYEDLEKESRKARYLQGLNISAKKHYTQNKLVVTNSKQNFQKVKQLLQ
ncbi:MAG: hypothetical protein F6K31_24000 [Symploca sp. SIO2G7]|nr:hypothetical protein [Symploca sp. SIO2G7]